MLIETILKLIQVIAPLYILILIGFIISKFTNIDSSSIATILLEGVLPIILFIGIATNKISLHLILLPFAVFILASLLTYIFYKIGRKFWQNSFIANIFGVMSVDPNTGYFGLPVALIIFSQKEMTVYYLSMVGISLYEATTCYYLFARSNTSSLEVIKKIACFPPIYAVATGFLVSILEIPLWDGFTSIQIHCKGAYTTLGMMLIGIGISKMNRFSIDLKFIISLLIAKCVAVPIITLSLLYIDTVFFGLLDDTFKKVVLYFSILPVAASVVAYALRFNVHPDKVASGVLICTLLAIIYVPVAIAVLGLL
jgi:malate permease and related proteins